MSDRAYAKAQAQQKTTTVPPSRGDLLRPSISSSLDKGLSDNSGQPLDAGTRAFMEPRFGHDFSGIRVYTDQRAADSAQSMNALAYTVGQDVVFGAGQYTPSTCQGQRLLAHELAHIVQQSRGGPRPVLNPAADYERDAEVVASAIVVGHSQVAV